MPGFEVRDSAFEVPPEDTYEAKYLRSLITKSRYGEALRHYFVIVEPGDHQDSVVTLMTGTTATPQNALGRMVEILMGQDELEIGLSGDLDDFKGARCRIFVEHKKGKNAQGIETTFANVSKVLTSQTHPEWDSEVQVMDDGKIFRPEAEDGAPPKGGQAEQGASNVPDPAEVNEDDIPF